ncbi:MAG TPA: hypothetical protein VKA27_04145 [Sunxiuqinia sp.]|nr:hypothetical protein [Sunxiuqinia sp.]
MRFFLTTFLILLVIAVVAQDRADSITAFHGYILTEDSVPVENAYLINYRTTKIITTDSTGYFNTYLHPGDSLMINHLTLKPKVIHANADKVSSNRFYVAYRRYQIPTVATKTFNRDEYYCQKNIRKIYADLERLGVRHVRPLRIGNGNIYDPDRVSPGVGISLSDLISFFKRK